MKSISEYAREFGRNVSRITSRIPLNRATYQSVGFAVVGFGVSLPYAFYARADDVVGAFDVFLTTSIVIGSTVTGNRIGAFLYDRRHRKDEYPSEWRYSILSNMMGIVGGVGTITAICYGIISGSLREPNPLEWDKIEAKRQQYETAKQEAYRQADTGTPYLIVDSSELRRMYEEMGLVEPDTILSLRELQKIEPSLDDFQRYTERKEDLLPELD